MAKTNTGPSGAEPTGAREAVIDAIKSGVAVLYAQSEVTNTLLRGIQTQIAQVIQLLFPAGEDADCDRDAICSEIREHIERAYSRALEGGENDDRV